MYRSTARQFLLRSALALLAAVGASVVTSPRAFAQRMMPTGDDVAGPQNITPARITEAVGVDQKLDAQVNPDLKFTDETGKTVRLGDYMGKRPLILSLVYYECPGLCTMTLNGVARSLRPLSFTPGKEFDVLTVSFNPKENYKLAAGKKKTYLNEYLSAGAAVSHDRATAESGWHFLTGDEQNVKELCKEVGFRYTFDEKTKQFAHASVIMVLTPKGRISRYFYGLEYSTKDIQLGLMESAEEKIGTVSDAVILYCYQYDPSSGKYSLAIMRFVRAAGALTVVGIILLVIYLARSGKNKKTGDGSGGVSTNPTSPALATNVPH